MIVTFFKMGAAAAAFLTICGAAAAAATWTVQIESPECRFAAEELRRLLEAVAPHPKPAPPPITMKLSPVLLGDEFVVQSTAVSVTVTGGSPRALLYAVYQQMEGLGYRWFAPQFDYYQGDAESLPTSTAAPISLKAMQRKPAFKYRKLYVEEGISHTEKSLRAIIDWMPKAGYNILVVPTDYGNRGRVRWDNWRDALTPELTKRGLLIEVGGHGYENFLNSRMDDGKWYREHPEWFAVDEAGKRSKRKSRVFCTSNKAAVDFVTSGVVSYLAKRPEIDIFDFWPPDSADWCLCEPCTSLGSPSDRQALLMNHLLKSVRRTMPKVQLETIAYGATLQLPTTHSLDASILIDFCPINQSFEVPIHAASSARNSAYADALKQWSIGYPGDISIYSYYRKYAWKSLPALLPRYMQSDLKYYQNAAKVDGISIYSEPADWGAYEVNHYVLPRLAWNPDLDVEALLADYTTRRFGTPTALTLINALEKYVRTLGSIPFTELKPAEQITAGRRELVEAMKDLDEPSSGTRSAGAIRRLRASAEYANRDLDIQESRARGDTTATAALVAKLHSFMLQAPEGAIMNYSGTDLQRLQQKYQVEAKP